MNWDNDYVSWKKSSGGSNDAVAVSDDVSDGKQFLTSALIPRPTAWISVYPSRSSSSSADGGDDEPLVALVEGYCGASDRPPTLLLGSESIPPQILYGLRENGVCTLSVATTREIEVAKGMSALNEESCGPAKTFPEAKLIPCDPPSILSTLPIPNCPTSCNKIISNYFRRPPAVDSSPVQMHCRLIMDVPILSVSESSRNDNAPSMILLQIDTYVIKGNTLRTQSTLYPGHTTLQGNPDVRSITAKIDCLLLRPLASLGNRQFGTVTQLYHMGRPRPLSKMGNDKKLSRSQKLINSCNPKNDGSVNDGKDAGLNGETCNNIDWESGSMWEIDDLVAQVNSNIAQERGEGNGQAVTYTYRLDSCCPLGYNPMKQVVCPRFIGWISTFEPTSLNGSTPIPHISPYSFFMDVARGSRPMVAFAACPRADEFANDSGNTNVSVDKSNDAEGNDSHWKDAQRDAELTGVFCVNLVSEELAWAMNASAAPLGKGLSEFRLMEKGGESRTVPTHVVAPTINAPFVPQSPAFMECRYVKTVKIPDIFEGDSMYSLIVGEVINIHMRKDCIGANEAKANSGGNNGFCMDLQKAKPVARLGYGQEYTVVAEYL